MGLERALEGVATKVKYLGLTKKGNSDSYDGVCCCLLVEIDAKDVGYTGYGLIGERCLAISDNLRAPRSILRRAAQRHSATTTQLYARIVTNIIVTIL